MSIHNPIILCLLFLTFLTPVVRADGVMRAVDPAYPDKLLKHTNTQVTVTLHGQVAETEVFCEFVNEWDRAADAVFSFPLPMDANATQMSYSKGALLYDAVLKPVMQSNNPGTGSGGFAAELNSYLGKNAVNLRLDKIPAHATQSVYLKYIQRLPFYSGLVHYRYPMKTGTFLPEPLAAFGMTVRVWEGSGKTVFQSQSHADGWQKSVKDTLFSVYTQEWSKIYLNQDFLFTVDMQSNHLRAEIFSTMGKSGFGHFIFSLYPDPAATQSAILKRNVIFLVDLSSSMSGFKLEESCEAIKSCLSGLDSGDCFAVAAFSDRMVFVRPLLPADPLSKASAALVLDSLSKVSGPSSSLLSTAVNGALSAFADNNGANILVVCTDGFSPCTPQDIVNTHHASLFAVGLGADVSRARLEALTYANSGFAIFLSEEDAIQSEMATLFNVLKKPLISAFNIDFAQAMATELLPDANPFMFFNGLGYFITGRFSVHGMHSAVLTGHSVSGDLNDLLSLNFSEDTAGWDGLFVEQMWAAEKIRAWEREIEVYNRAALLRDSVINLSLAYGVKSQYTSFWADDSSKPADSLNTDPGHPPTSVSKTSSGEEVAVGLTVQPNPFNPSTRITVNCAGLFNGRAELCIYSVSGKLVKKLIGRFAGNRAEFAWDGTDMSGSHLASGVYVGRINVKGKLMETRMFLAK